MFFPDKYNDTILINCTISDLKDINASEGFIYVKNADKIKVGFKTLKAYNFFQVNTKIFGYSDIINEADKSNITCDTSLSSTVKKILVVVGSLIVIATIILSSVCL